MGDQPDTRPSVTITGTTLIEEGNYVEYQLLVRCGRETFRVSKRFSELLKIHKQLKSAWADDASSGSAGGSDDGGGGGGGGGTGFVVPIPKFPSKRRAAGAHLIRPGQVAERVAELQEYFDELFSAPQFLANPVFCDALGLGDGPSARLRQLLEQIGHLALAEELRSGAASSVSSASSQQQQQHRKTVAQSPLLSRGKRRQAAGDNDFQYAQRFHRLAKVVSARGADAPTSTDQRQLLRQESGKPGAAAQAAAGGGLLGEDDDAAPIPALYFTHPLRFVLRVGLWTGDDKAVREAPGGRTWFSLLGPVPSVAVGKHPRQSDYFALVNASTAAVPLIFLSAVAPAAPATDLQQQQQSHFAIWEAMSDGTVGARLCTVGCTRRSGDTVEYAMLANSGDGKHDVTCEGTWRRDFRFHQSGDTPSGGPSATVSTRTPRDAHFAIEITAHRDVIFYLALALAIERLEALAAATAV